ncbi:MAG: SAM-dependent methyltransferase [Lentimicrobiaceae bacterium]|nr:SAM-dependent methyltransferase [Lentimicrobiaceae bacterium]
MKKKSGKLFLIPTFLGNTNPEDVLPAGLLPRISHLTGFVVEEVKTARRFLRKIGYLKNFDEVVFMELNEHTPDDTIFSYLNDVEKGNDIGLMSEAGVPCVADPGNKIVKLAHEKQIEVIPLVGPSSILLALMASGLNGQNFSFCGYLPIKNQEKILKIKELEQKSKKENQTQIFIEAPYRNMQLLTSLLQTCQKNTLLCIACDLTLPKQYISTKTIDEWKKDLPGINKRAAVFLLQLLN